MKEYWTIKRVATGGRWDRSQWFGKDRAEWVKFTSRAVAYSTLVTFLNKQWEGDEKFRVVHHTVKPRGAKVGSWAWACEQMLAGHVVWRSAHQTKYYIDYFGTMFEADPKDDSRRLATVCEKMMRATSWGRVQ